MNRVFMGVLLGISMTCTVVALVTGNALLAALNAVASLVQLVIILGWDSI